LSRKISREEGFETSERRAEKDNAETQNTLRFAEKKTQV
jgi:hypothetical protein